MKKLSLKSILFFMALAVMLFPACEPDDGTGGPGSGGGIANAPFLDLSSSIDYSATTIAPGETFTVTLDATSGDADLNALTIYGEDGFQIDPSRFSISGISTVNNPQVITGTDVGGFTWDITITAHTFEGVGNYEFEVTDVNQLTTSESIDITTDVGFVSSGPIDVNFGNISDGAIISGVEAGSLFKIDLDIPTGDSPLSSIAVRENGTLISVLSRLRFKDVGTEFASNPLPFEGSDVNGFLGSIWVQIATGANEITVEVANDGGETASSTFTLDSGPVGTPVNTITGVLLNSAGVAGTGGLDIDTGMGTGSFDGAAEIRDLGIDINQPMSSNWKRQITTVNGASMRTPDLSIQPDGFDFANIATIEEVQSLYDTGFDIPSGGTNVVNINDLFVVSANGTYYLMLVTNIVETTNDNSDSYEFSIKKL